MVIAEGAPNMRLPLIASIVFFASTAAAQNEPPPPPPPMPAPAQLPPEPEAPKRIASITFSPIHLLMPVVEVTAEFAINDKIGVAGILGYGSISAETATQTGIQKRRFRAYEVGGHFNYYVIGSFDHGMQLGLEALYVKVVTDNNIEISGAANGLALGPYVGYKVITNVGFTFEANGGFQYVAMRADATDGTNTASVSQKKVIPLLNLNIGWSF